MQSRSEARAIPGRGLDGDRYYAGRGFYSKKPSYGGREVTLIEMEAIEALFHGVINADAKRLGFKLAPGDARRNIVTSGVPLNHLTDREFWIGTALFFGCACAQPRQINPFGQCSPVGKAHRCVPISRRLQLAAKAAHSSAVGFFRPSSP
jgi:hypothetical protein